MLVEVLDPPVDAVVEFPSDSVLSLCPLEAPDVPHGVLHPAVVPGRCRWTGQRHDAPFIEEVADALLVEDGAAVALEDQGRAVLLEGALQELPDVIAGRWTGAQAVRDLVPGALVLDEDELSFPTVVLEAGPILPLEPVP